MTSEQKFAMTHMSSSKSLCNFQITCTMTFSKLVTDQLMAVETLPVFVLYTVRFSVYGRCFKYDEFLLVKKKFIMPLAVAVSVCA